MNRMSERETAVELPFAADCCPCVEKLRTVLPFIVGIRDGVVQLVSTLGSAVISARAELGGGVHSTPSSRVLPPRSQLTPYISSEITPRSGSIRGFN
jgi:hypothetical protein